MLLGEGKTKAGFWDSACSEGELAWSLPQLSQDVPHAALFSLGQLTVHQRMSSLLGHSVLVSSH